MAKEADDTSKIITEAFVQADDAFWEDPSIVMGTQAAKTRKLFDHLKRGWKAWERSGPCMCRGCTEPSIRRSHSIHRAGSLERIAEAQHVLTPRLDNNGQMRMERVGVNLASTFPEFCEQHEQLFSEFEVSGAVTSTRHVALQAFRTLCREIARKRQGLADLEKLLDEYRKARADHYATAILEANPGAKFEKLTVKGDGMEERLVSLLKGGKADLAELEGDLYEELFDYITTQSQEPSLQALSLPFEVPVSCSGFGVLTYEYLGTKHRALCPLGILPQAGTTVAFIGAARKHSVVVEKYRSDMELGFGALNAMESWLTNGSDHWFIRPSAWESIPPARQAKVLDLLLSEEDNIGSLLDFSILDDIRRNIVSYIKDHLAEAEDQETALKMVGQETAKLAA
jgi:hypothetical protein